MVWRRLFRHDQCMVKSGACFPSLHSGLHIQPIPDLVENVVKDAGGDPSPKSPIHSVPFAKHFRQVSPRSAGSADPNHPFQCHPIIVAVPTRFTRSTWQCRFDKVPLPVSQSQYHFQAGRLHIQCAYEPIVPIPEVISIWQEGFRTVVDDGILAYDASGRSDG